MYNIDEVMSPSFLTTSSNCSRRDIVMKCFVLQRGSIALILFLDRLSDSCLNASVLTPASSQASFSFEV